MQAKQSKAAEKPSSPEVAQLSTGDGLESLRPRPDGGVGLSLRLGVGQGLHVHQQALQVPSVHGYRTGEHISPGVN